MSTAVVPPKKEMYRNLWKKTKSIYISEKNFTIQWGLMTPKKQYNRIETGTKRALDLRSILNKIFRLTKRNVHQGSRKCVFSGFAGWCFGRKKFKSAAHI